jgi:hypothetical protein
MKLAISVLALALPLSAGVVLHHGDSLTFDVSVAGFAANAARYGLPQSPTDISFTFITAPLAASPAFSAWLDFLPFPGPLVFAAGYVSSSAYTGPASVIQSQMHFAPPQPDVFLTLRNDGGDVSLGLPATTLLQDLTVSVSGGPLNVGGVPEAVWLSRASSAPTAGGAAAAASVPEPGTIVLLLIGVGLLGASASLRNMRRPGR